MTTHTETISTETEPTLSRPAALTIETALWAGIGIAALALRLAALTRYPLNESEAAQTMSALTLYRGGIPGGDYSPLLTSLAGGAFLLFGATDWAARLVNVLLGTLLVLLPFGLRRELGRLGALAAAILLTVSASPLFFSRAIGSDMAAAVGAMLVLVGGARWLAENRPRGLYAIGGGLALLLTAGTAGFSALAVLLLMLGATVAGNRQTVSQLQARFAAERETVRRAALWFGIALFILATAATFNFNGFAAISEQFTRWLTDFGIAPRPGGALPAVVSLLFYEPLVVVFGAVGLARATAGKDPLRWLLVAWIALAILLDIVQSGRSDGQLLLIFVPLALLAGEQLGALWHNWRNSARLESDGLLVAIGLMVVVFVYVSLMSWTKCTAAQAGCGTAWILPAAGAALIIGLAIVFGNWYGRDTAFRGLAVIALVVFGVLSVGLSWRLSFGKLYDLPFEPIFPLPASSRLPDLNHDLQKFSMARAGDAHEIDIAVVDADVPQLRWYLRNFRTVKFVPDFASAQDASIVLARPQTGNPNGSYTGEEFALVSFWTPSQLQGKDWLRWYIYRHLPNHNPGHDQLVLWLRADGE